MLEFGRSAWIQQIAVALIAIVVVVLFTQRRSTFDVGFGRRFGFREGNQHLTAANACETAWRTLGLQSEPPLTRFLVLQLTTAHWFNIDAARNELGWRPRVTIEDGMTRLAQWVRATRPFDP